MQEHTINWSHAYTGRLTKEALRKYHCAAAFAARLENEIDKLPFINLHYKAQLEEDMAIAVPHCEQFDHMLLLGIGGSALGARALQKAFAPGQDAPNHQGRSLWIADNVCAKTFDSWLEKLPAKKTVVVCISKSGGTIETISQYFLTCAWLKAQVGEDWAKHMILITDAEVGFLRQEVKKHNYISLEVPNYLGGRYSALSAVGLLPAAFLGIDWQALLVGATKVAQPLFQDPENIAIHPSYTMAIWAMGLEAVNYNELIFFSYIPTWSHFGSWFVQLWAESLGKEGKGSMPIAATGVTDQHSTQQIFLDGPRNKACIFLTSDDIPQGPRFPEGLPKDWQWLENKHFGELLHAEALGTRMSLHKHTVPLLHINMANTHAEAAGSLMTLLEITTLFTGWLMGINPLDQPAVELGKRFANARLGAQGYEQEQNELENFVSLTQERQIF